MSAIKRGKITRSDLALWDGKTAKSSRVDASGATTSGYRVNDYVDVLNVFGGKLSASTIDKAIAHVGSSNVTLRFHPSVWDLNSSITIPSNITAYIPAGCVFDVQSGSTLTFNGPVIHESATWTSGSGTVVESGHEIHQWDNLTAAESDASVTPVDYSYPPGYVLRYGVNTTPNTTDMTTAFQTAVNVAEAQGYGTVFIPNGDYLITAPIVTDSSGVSFIGEGTQSSVITLNSSTAGDYAIKLGNTGYSGYNNIEGIGFKGTNNANNQGAILIAGRYQYMNIQRCAFNDFTGYAIGRDPSVTSYTQNNALRDLQFYNVGGCYGLISEPANSANYLAETLLTIDNINLDSQINPTDPKPYIWDFRASRNIVAGIILMEGTGAAGQDAAIAFATDGFSLFKQFWYEFVTTSPTYSIIFVADPNNKFHAGAANYVQIDSTNAGQPIRFEEELIKMESRVSVGYWYAYNATSFANIVSFEGDQGKVEIKEFDSKWNGPLDESYYGRLSIGMVGSDNEQKQIIGQRAQLLARWDASMGPLTDLNNTYVNVTEYNSGTHVASRAIEADGDLLVQRYTGIATNFPTLQIDLSDCPAAWDGAFIQIAIRYRVTFDAADTGSTVNTLYGTSTNFGAWQGYGQTEKNASVYTTAYAKGRLDSSLATPGIILVRGLGTAPTVAPILHVASFEVWLGDPRGDWNMLSIPADDSLVIPKSSGTTGGSASAGAGNQYVEVKIGDAIYKVLHDGTV